MGVFFSKQDKVAFRTQEEVTAYWLKHGAHQLSDAEVDGMLDLMVDDVTFKITTDIFCENLGTVDANAHILDAGCGWGRSLIGLKRRYPDAHFTGVDVTGALLELGQNICDRLDIGGVEWKEASLLELPFEDGTFSHIVSTRVLHYMVEPETAAKELMRVLKPGGPIIAMVPNRWNPLLAMCYHTNLYSPKNLRAWFSGGHTHTVSSGSIGFIPPFRFLRKYAGLDRVDRVLRRIPCLRGLGGLAYVVARKQS